MRVKFVVLALFMGGLVLLLGPTTGLTQFQGRGNRGAGGGGFGGMQQDPGRIFEWMAQGQQTLVIANQRFGREEMEAWAQKQGISNGQLTREQFISYSQSPEAQQARERMAQLRGAGGGRPGGPGGAGGAPGGPAPGAPASPGGAPGGNRGGWNRGGGGDPNAGMDEWFRRLDKDGDGYLSYEEMTENLK